MVQTEKQIKQFFIIMVSVYEVAVTNTLAEHGHQSALACLSLVLVFCVGQVTETGLGKGV